ncbi:MAG: metal ABC transporter permease [Candidatus Nucleicultricaceae bacterium]
MYHFFIEPFMSYAFLNKALVVCLILSLSCSPIGVLLVLRRMSLLGDALSHSVLPGVAIGYMIAGLSLIAMGLGGLIAGLLVALLATLVSRYTQLREDASFVGFYLIALSLGAILISLKGNSVDLMHILFGDILSVSRDSLVFMASVTSLTLIVLAIIYRPLVIECFDPIFMRSIGAHGTLYHIIFMFLVVINMVSAFQALGTLMALGLVMLPAIASRFWTTQLWRLMILSSCISLISSYLGLVLSFHYNWPSGPAISLIAGLFYVFSLLVGHHGSVLRTCKNA